MLETADAGLWVPLVHLDAVYVLPGVPGLSKRMVEASLHRFRGPEAHSAELYTDEGQTLPEVDEGGHSNSRAGEL